MHKDSVIFVLAGNYEEFTQFLRRTTNLADNLIYVSKHEMLLGTRNPKTIKLDNFYCHPDYTNIVREVEKRWSP